MLDTTTCKECSLSIDGEREIDLKSKLQKSIRNCDACSKESPSKKCSRCRNTYYCDRECQISHWQVHKKECNQQVKILETIEEKEKNSILCNLCEEKKIKQYFSKMDSRNYCDSCLLSVSESSKFPFFITTIRKTKINTLPLGTRVRCIDRSERKLKSDSFGKIIKIGHMKEFDNMGPSMVGYLILFEEKDKRTHKKWEVAEDVHSKEYYEILI